ncbi:MAG: hypothetical protein JXR77_15450 [Lentisphaeria bacterium]|nr:hypothetical protein [Lentisphaeria bacterium]
MMRRSRMVSGYPLPAILALAVSAALWAQDPVRQSAPVSAPGSLGEPWFQDIQEPLAWTREAGQALCRSVFDGLRNRSLPATALGSFPGGMAPRAVFLSWSDGQTTARSAFGVGESAETALAQAFDRALSAGAGGGSAAWVKVDVVQHAEATGGFVTRESRLPLPSLLGLTFGPATTFVFLPEQLVAWNMVDPMHRLTIHHISERLLAEHDWQRAGRWLAVANYTGGQRICLFETESFFCAGGVAVPLFRGHPLYDNPTVTELLAAARAAGDRIADYCRKDGTFQCDLPEWEPGRTGPASPADQALAVLALVRLHRATGEKTYLEAAIRAAGSLARNIRPYGTSPRAGCLPEPEEVEDSGGVVGAREITKLSSNALVLTALCEVSEALGDGSLEVPLAMLARHLALQMQPDGTMVGSRRLPSHKVGGVAEADAVGTAVLALAQLYGAVARPTFLAQAERACTRLRTQILDTVAMEGLPRDAWTLEALDRIFTFTRDRTLGTTVQRLAMAALLDQNREPDILDEYGAVGTHPSATVAADRTRLLAVAAALLHDLGQRDAATNLLAEMRPYLLYQLQARIEPASAMYLPRPAEAVGLFRDHLRDYGFALRGQASQVLSLLALTRTLQSTERETLPEDLQVAKSLNRARAAATRFPRYLSPRLAATAASPVATRGVEYHEAGSETFTIVPIPDKDPAKPGRQPGLKPVRVRRLNE